MSLIKKLHNYYVMFRIYPNKPVIIIQQKNRSKKIREKWRNRRKHANFLFTPSVLLMKFNLALITTLFGKAMRNKQA